MNDELLLYSPEPLWEDLYSNFFTVGNGVKIRFANINRGNNKNKIYVTLDLTGKAYVNIYRGYYNNGILTYELSNHQLIEGVGDEVTYYFQDFTESNLRYINYYVEIEPIEDISVKPLATGLYFDDIFSSNSFINQFSTPLQNDINSTPLQEQFYDKSTNFKLVVNRGYIQQVVNVIEKPFYFINKIDDCLDNSTLRLANKSISTSYVSSHTKYVEMTLTNTEEI